MTTALQQVLERIGTLAEALDPHGQAYALESLEKLASELEEDRAWDELLASPESAAYLREREQEVLCEYANGQTEPGGWE